MPPKTAKRRLGDVLLEQQLITEEQLRECVAVQRSSGQNLAHILVEKGYLDEEDLVGHVVAERSGHRVHAAFVRGLLADKSCWRIEERRPSESRSAVAVGAGSSLFGLSSPRPLAHPE